MQPQQRPEPAVFATALSFPEAPVLLADGTWIVTEMGSERGCVTHVSADGRDKRTIAKTGRPNGLAVDKNGVIWVAETLFPSLIRLDQRGRAETVLTECNGEKFLFPNDLCFGPDGALYMTDSGLALAELMQDGKVSPDCDALPADGRIYRIDVSRMRIELLDRGIRFSNGIAFGSDHKLYVTESFTGNIYRYNPHDPWVANTREYFGNVSDPTAPGKVKAPDGIAFGTDGNLYVAVFGQGTVTVLDKNGNVLEHIRTTGRYPTNLAFGLSGTQKLYVTEDEHGQIEVMNMDTDGCHLYG